MNKNLLTGQRVGYTMRPVKDAIKEYRHSLSTTYGEYFTAERDKCLTRKIVKVKCL